MNKRHFYSKVPKAAGFAGIELRNRTKWDKWFATKDDPESRKFILAQDYEAFCVALGEALGKHTFEARGVTESSTRYAIHFLPVGKYLRVIVSSKEKLPSTKDREDNIIPITQSINTVIDKESDL